MSSTPNFFINILILPLLLLLILGIVLSFTKIVKLRMNRLLTWRHNMILAGVYVAFLLILVPIYYLLPGQGFMPAAEGNYRVFQDPKIDPENPSKYPFPQDGNIAQVPGVYKNDSHKFLIDTNKLRIELSPNARYSIFISRKDVDDGKIEVDSYIAPQVAGGIDFTKAVYPPAIFWRQGTLLIQEPSKQQLEFQSLIADFTINQFKQVNQGFRNMGAMAFGWKAIYLRVPKSLEIDSGTANVQMVPRY